MTVISADALFAGSATLLACAVTGFGEGGDQRSEIIHLRCAAAGHWRTRTQICNAGLADGTISAGLQPECQRCELKDWDSTPATARGRIGAIHLCLCGFERISG